jgi:parallel beta-helix repeat protein
VVVAGFTVQNANFEGILATNASLITIQGNVVTGNDKSLIPATPACPGIPAWETAEAFDCGEAIHLSGVDHATVANNLVQNNAGGILLSDDTGATHDNSLTGNIAQHNPYDCGFVLASHPPAFGGAPAGVYNNPLSGNQSASNGLGIAGAGGGMGIFTFLPGGTVSGNVLGNYISGNGAERDQVRNGGCGGEYTGRGGSAPEQSEWRWLRRRQSWFRDRERNQ